MGRQERLERIGYLERVAERVERAAAGAAAALAGPLLQALAGLRALVLAAALAVTVSVLAVAAYKLRARIEGMWGEILREDPWWASVPWVALASLAVVVAVLAALLAS